MANGRDIDFIAVTLAVAIVTITSWVITSERDADGSSLDRTLPRRSYACPVNYLHSL